MVSQFAAEQSHLSCHDVAVGLSPNFPELIEHLVTGRERGSHPADPMPREALRRRLSYEIDADIHAAFKEAGIASPAVLHRAVA